MLEIEIQNQLFNLLPEKAIYWKEKEYLLIADLHLGKAAHFRKSGIQVPLQVEFENLSRLQEIFLAFELKGVFFLGDLFHSESNHIWNEFARLIKQFSNINFNLIVGNHDILTASDYQKLGINIHLETYEEDAFIFSHDAIESIQEGKFLFHGHIHPGISLKSGPKLKTTLPCFYKEKKRLILPAFGAFTGLFTMPVNKKSEVFVIANNDVVSLAVK